MLHAITVEIMQKATNESNTLAKLKYCILKRGYLDNIPELKAYEGVFRELSIAKQLVMRGRRIVVPESLQEDIVALAHIGHQGATKTKQYLRERVWFPRMDIMVEKFVSACTPCLAATPGENFQPLQTSEMPKRPWQYLATDFKGPIGNQFYFLLIIDEYSRYPEVEIVTSTSAESVIPKFERVFATHGIPEKLKSDNGLPFNSEDMRNYAKQEGFFHQKITPKQPSSNGLAENFMRMLLKVAHTAYIEKKDPRREVYKYLLAYRATPHSTTGKTPAELLFNRKIKTPVTMLHKSEDKDQALRRKVAMKMRKVKMYHDQKRKAKHSDIKVGDNVLVQQKKTSVKPFFDQNSYQVTSRKGTMVTACRRNKCITRNVSKFKKIPNKKEGNRKVRFENDYPTVTYNNMQPLELEEQIYEEVLEHGAGDNINGNGEPVRDQETVPVIPRRSERDRRTPDYLKNYVT